MADTGTYATSAAGGALSGAAAGATVGGPIGAIIGAGIGLGISLFGTSQQVAGAKKQSAASQQIVQYEMQQDSVRRQAMEISARRQTMEVFRNTQRARSLALQNATNQGAQFGSGLQGGFGQISGQSGTNLVNINQNLEQGEQMFDLNAKISGQKIAYAAAGGQISQGSGLTALGGNISNSASAFGRLSQGFGGGTSIGAGGVSGGPGWSSVLGLPV